MAFLLPALTYAFLALYLWGRFVGREEDLPLARAILAAAVLFAAFTAVVTEVLSLFNLFSFWPLVVVWLFAAGLAAFMLYRSRLKAEPVLRPQGFFEWFALAAIGMIALVTLVLALLSPPSTYDSMTYHMPRVMHWIQNQGIGFYPSGITRQLVMAPLAEYGIAHTVLLYGGDRYASLVQWAAFIGLLSAAWLLAGRLGAGRRGRVLAALFTATMPIVIAQASGTQNDLVAALFMTSAVFYLLENMRETGVENGVLAGLALGLAALSKGTAYFICFPFVAWWFVALARKLKFAAWKPVVILGLLALALNVGHYARTARVFGSPLSDGGAHVANEKFTPAAFVSNVTRNLTLQVAFPLYSLKNAEEKAVRAVHRAVGADPSDPATTYGSTTHFQVRKWSTDEGLAPNPFHFLLIIGAAIASVVFRRAGRGELLVFFACLLIAAALFCLLLKWQYWHTRLHAPMLIMGVVAAAVVMDKLNFRRIGIAISIFLALISSYWLFNHWTRPVFGRTSPLNLVETLGIMSESLPFDGRSVFEIPRHEQYFWNHPSMRKPTRELAEYVNSRDYERIGVCLMEDDYEYPYWVFIQGADRSVEIRHVGVRNPSAELVVEFEPQAVICTAAMLAEENPYIEELKRLGWTPREFGPLSVFEPPER